MTIDTGHKALCPVSMSHKSFLSVESQTGHTTGLDGMMETDRQTIGILLDVPTDLEHKRALGPHD